MKYVLSLIVAVLALIVVTGSAQATEYEWKDWTAKQVHVDQSVTLHRYRTADIHGAVNIMYWQRGKLEHVATVSLFNGKPYVRWTVGKAHASRRWLPKRLLRYYYS